MRAEPKEGPRGPKSWETSSEQEVRALSAVDIEKKTHTILDVVMPLPGWNIAYPEGKIGDLYGQIMRADGLDPAKMRRDQR